MQDTFLTVEEAARRLAVTPYTLREWLKTGKIYGVQVSRRWRVPERELSALATKHSGLGDTKITSPLQSTMSENNTVETIKARLQMPMTHEEIEASRIAIQEMYDFFDQLNAEAEVEAGEPLSHYTNDDFVEMINATRDERETEQL